MTKPVEVWGHRCDTTLRSRVSFTGKRYSTRIVSPDRLFDVSVSDEHRRFLWFDTELSVSCHLVQPRCISLRYVRKRNSYPMNQRKRASPAFLPSRRQGGHNEEPATDLCTHHEFAIPTISPDMDGKERACSTSLLSQAYRTRAE